MGTNSSTEGIDVMILGAASFNKMLYIPMVRIEHTFSYQTPINAMQI